MKTLGDVLPQFEALVAWMREHPELPMPHGVSPSIGFFDDNAKEHVATWARAFGRGRKTYSDTGFSISKKLGDYVEFMVVCERNAVCTRRVVGTREVAEKITPAHTEEIVEWDCGVVLKPDSELPEASKALPEPAVVGELIS